MTEELKQAAQQALEVLKSATSFMSKKARDQHQKTVARLERALTAAQPAKAVQVPEGFALVPVVPTISMLMAGDKSRLSMEHPSRSSAVWSAMLTAAQQGADPEDIAAAGVMLVGRRSDHG